MSFPKQSTAMHDSPFKKTKQKNNTIKRRYVNNHGLKLIISLCSFLKRSPSWLDIR